MKLSSMQCLLQAAVLFGATLAVVACGDDPDFVGEVLVPPSPVQGEGGSNPPEDGLGPIESELREFEAEANKRARRVCGQPEDIAEEDLDEAAYDCVNSFSVDPDPCESDILVAHPEEARAVIACTEYELTLLVACCTEDGPCDAEKAWDCDLALFVEDVGGPCADALADAAYDRLYDSCE